jgi:hypothetical protein
VLAAHAHDIATPLYRVEAESEREVRLRADLMGNLELRDLVFGPRVMAVTSAPSS